MQDYGFDRFESRVPWNQTKWDPDVLEEKFGSSDVLPAWIADMDFKTRPSSRPPSWKRPGTACTATPASARM